MRIDCFAVLLALIKCKDKVVQQIFERHLSFVQAHSGKYGRFQSADQSTLLQEIVDRTEDEFQSLLRNFSMEQQQVIFSKRDQFDKGY